jgi:hypothetical protein
MRNMKGVRQVWQTMIINPSMCRKKWGAIGEGSKRIYYRAKAGENIITKFGIMVLSVKERRWMQLNNSICQVW